MKSPIRLWPVLVALALTFSLGCSSEEDDPPPPPPPVPSIADINSSADPKSPTGVAIEVNGAGFLDAPGSVRFDDGVNPYVEVVPDASGWTDASIVVVVPASFSAPLTVTVTVVTANGTSNGVALDLVAVPSFNPSNLAWGPGPALPEALQGLKAIAVPHSDSHATVIVSGGRTGGATPANRASVRSLGLQVSGPTFTTDANWTAETSLPSSRAFHAMAAAHPENSPVASGSAFLYVIGGQENASDAPGGSDVVLRASVNPATGAVGVWAEEASRLPAARWGHSALVTRGVLFVIGGFDASGNPAGTIFQADVAANGALGSFSTSGTVLPTAMGNFAAFAFGGRLYLLGGESSASTNPASSAAGGEMSACSFAPLTGGAVGAFAAASAMGKDRKKHVAWNSFGQVVVAEGIYGGSVGNSEMTRNAVLSDGTLGSWNGLTGGNAANANVFDAAAALSPISPQNGGPRFLLIGGADANSPFAPVSSVWINTAP